MSVATDRQVSVNLRANVTPYVAAMRAATRATGELQAALASASRSTTRIATATAALATSSGTLASATAATNAQLRTSILAHQNAAAAAQAQTAALNQQTAALRAQAAAGAAATASSRAQAAAFTQVGSGLLKVGAGFAAVVAVAVVAAARFDLELSKLQSVSNATGAEMRALSAAAIEAGEATAFSATEAAQAQTELAKAGISTADILGGALSGALALAAAGGLDLARAAEVAGQSMQIFGLEADQVGRVADVLSNGANTSAADIEGLAQSLAQGGLVAAQTGLTLEETVAALSAFADSALVGSDAGTSLKTMLQRLTPQSEVAQREFDRLGLSAYDAQGNFVGLEEFAGRLQTSLMGLTDEQRNASLGILFGSDAIRGASILYEQGAEGIARYVGQMSTVGTAAVTAAQQTDNLVGDLERLGGALETAFIVQGEGAQGPLRELVQDITGVVDAYNDLSPAAQSAIGQFILVGGGALILGGGILALTGRVLAARVAFMDLAATSPGLARGLRGAAVAGAGLTALFVGLSVANAARGAVEGIMSVAEATEFLARTTSDVTLNELNAQLAVLAGNSAGKFDLIGDDFSSLEAGLRSLTDPSLGQRIADFEGHLFSFGDQEGSRARDAFIQQVSSMDSALAGLVSSGNADAANAQFVQFAQEAAKAGLTVSELREEFPEYADALTAAQAAEAASAVSVETLATQAAGLTTSTEDATAALDTLSATLDAILGRAFSVEAATRNFEAAIDDVTATLAENGTSLDLNTEAGRANSAALQTMTEDSFKLIEAYARQGATSQEVAGLTGQLKQRMYETGIQAGLTEQEARRYSDTLDEIPAVAETTIQTPGLAAALAGAQALDRTLSGLAGRRVQTTVINEIVQRGGNTGGGLATGGYIRGPGTGTSDSIPAWLSDGEYVIKAAAVARYGPDFFHQVNAMRFAAGGMVNQAPRPAAQPVSQGPAVAITYGDQYVADGRDAARQQQRAWQDALNVAGVR